MMNKIRSQWDEEHVWGKWRIISDSLGKTKLRLQWLVTELLMRPGRAVKRRRVWEWEMLYIQCVSWVRACVCVCDYPNQSRCQSFWTPAHQRLSTWLRSVPARARVCVCVCVGPLLRPSICPPQTEPPSSTDWNAWPRGFWERTGPRRAGCVSPQAMNVQNRSFGKFGSVAHFPDSPLALLLLFLLLLLFHSIFESDTALSLRFYGCS